MGNLIREVFFSIRQIFKTKHSTIIRTFSVTEFVNGFFCVVAVAEAYYLRVYAPSYFAVITYIDTFSLCTRRAKTEIGNFLHATAQHSDRIHFYSFRQICMI